MQNRKAEAAVTAHLVDTDETPTTFRARPAETGASNQQRARTDQSAEDGAREHPESAVMFDCAEVIAALPGAVDEAMRKNIPSKYTPELASELAKDMVARLTGTKCTVYEDCTDTAPGHYDHYSRFAVDDDTNGPALIDAGMVHNSGSDVGAIVHLGNAEFTETTVLRAKTSKVRHLLERAERMGDRVLGVDARTVDSIDERIKDDVASLVSLLAYRRRLAIALNPGKTKFAETEAKQEASAAFDLATRALDTALAVTPDRDRILGAVAGWLRVVENEDRGL